MVTRFFSSLLFNIARLLSFLPFKWLYVFSGFIAFILRTVLGYRKGVIIQNLSRSFPELKYNEISAISNRFYRHFADVFIEVIKSISLSGTNFRKRYKIENPELIVDYHHNDQNIIALTGHIGNWEWMSIIPSLFPFPCYTLYKPLRSKLAENLMTRIRHRFGMKLLSMANAARFILSNKNSKAMYIFIGDQSPHKSENEHRINFLHQPTAFFNGGAKLARATKAAIVYISIKKVKRGYYSVSFIPIEISANRPKDSESPSTIVSNSDFEGQVISSYAKLLENDIKNNPVDWLWSHKRWKR